MKQKPMYGYAVETPEGLAFVGSSRSYDCKTIIDVHPEGVPTLENDTPVVRATGYDKINTELGYLHRDEYHARKKWLKEFSSK